MLGIFSIHPLKINITKSQESACMGCVCVRERISRLYSIVYNTKYPYNHCTEKMSEILHLSSFMSSWVQSPILKDFFMTSSLHEQKIFISHVLLSVIECVCACACVFTMSHDLLCILFKFLLSNIYANLHSFYSSWCVFETGGENPFKWAAGLLGS